MTQSHTPLLTDDTRSAIVAPNNLGLIRYFFATIITLSHISVLTGVPLWLPITADMRVKGFFIISGFLISMSYLSSRDLGHYLSRRLRRLMPGYWAAIGFCLLTGLCFTTLSAADFLRSPQTLRYLAANLLTLNFLCPTLPGVFESHLSPALDGSLWTIKVELQLYLMMPVVIWLCRRFNRDVVLILTFLLSTLYGETMLALHEHTGSGLYEFLSRQGPGMLRYFAAGTFAMFHFLRYKRRGALLAIGSLIVYLLWGHEGGLAYRLVEPVVLTSLILGAGYLLPYCAFLQRHDNISYGIYLYHYPIAQALIALGLFERSFTLAAGLTFALTIGMAWLSWHLIEKRWLSRRATTAGRRVAPLQNKSS